MTLVQLKLKIVLSCTLERPDGQRPTLFDSMAIPKVHNHVVLVLPVA